MRGTRPWLVVAIALTFLGTLVMNRFVPTIAADTDCARRLVAGGDAVVNGKDAKSPGDDIELSYSRQLLDDHLIPSPGPWCEYNTSKDPTNTDQYVDEIGPTGLSQQGEAWEKEPRLITLTLGRQNESIVEHVTTCLQNIKDHDFLEANACALAVLANQPAWDKLSKDLAEILNTYKIQQDGQPKLIVAVTGYFNPYPSSIDVATQIPGFCAQLIDTIPTCIVRWILLPPALVTLDLVVKKLNTTIEEVVKRFHESSQGRFFFINPYDKFKDHCTEMKVTIKTKVFHPGSNDVHNHDTQETNFGCKDTWIGSDGKDGTKTPFLYLTPAATGVLIFAEQTTKNMGIHPNEDGHDCISDLIWAAVKNKLDVPQPSNEPEPCT